MNDDKKLKLVFAPGCFDQFEGTQEELQDLIAQLHQMVDSGKIFEEAVPVDPEEEARIYEMLRQQEKRQ